MLMTMLKRNLPDTYLFDLDGQIAGITMQDVRAVAGRLVRLDKMASVCIGKPAVSQYTLKLRNGDRATKIARRLIFQTASQEQPHPPKPLSRLPRWQGEQRGARPRAPRDPSAMYRIGGSQLGKDPPDRPSAASYR